MNWRELEEVARKQFGVRHVLPAQREILAAVLGGRDVLGVMPTGSGKSLCYQLAAHYLEKAVVVVSPLIALMQDQREELEETSISAVTLNSTLSAREEREAADQIRSGGADIVFVTPERLERSEYLDLLRQRGVGLFVVDEAHCISQWGHDFRPSYLALRGAIRALGHPPVLALTATATPEVADDILKQLAIEDAELVNAGIERPNLFLEVSRTVNTEVKRARIRQLLEHMPGAAIVYVATIRTAEELWKWLDQSGIRAARYHGKLKASDREALQNAFMGDEVRVMVATKAFGLGINKPDIRLVIHYHFPDSLESYYQEAGRAGRDGQPSRGCLLYRIEDRRIQSWFLGGRYPTRVESVHLYETLAALARERGSPRGIELAKLAEAASITIRRAKVIVAQLEAAGIVDRSRGRIAIVREPSGDAELEALLSAYEERRRADRERVDRMVRYAQTTLCRFSFLREYFGEEPADGCGHCDNCLHPPVVRPRRNMRASGRPAEAFVRTPQPPPFAAGERVRHVKFGEGEVLDLEEQNVRVLFPRYGEKLVRASHLDGRREGEGTGEAGRRDGAGRARRPGPR